jgi:hypothetical protein
MWNTPSSTITIPANAIHPTQPEVPRAPLVGVVLPPVPTFWDMVVLREP